jgi:uncharacterized protein YpmB
MEKKYLIALISILILIIFVTIYLVYSNSFKVSSKPHYLENKSTDNPGSSKAYSKPYDIGG